MHSTRCASFRRNPRKLGTEPVSLRRSAFLLVFFLASLSVSILCFAQIPRTRAAKPTSQDNFRQHYDAARTFQISVDEVRAAAAYRAFLVRALRTTSKRNAGLAHVDWAAAHFTHGLRLT